MARFPLHAVLRDISTPHRPLSPSYCDPPAISTSEAIPVAADIPSGRTSWAPPPEVVAEIRARQTGSYTDRRGAWNGDYMNPEFIR